MESECAVKADISFASTMRELRDNTLSGRSTAVTEYEAVAAAEAESKWPINFRAFLQIALNGKKRSVAGKPFFCGCKEEFRNDFEM